MKFHNKYIYVWVMFAKILAHICWWPLMRFFKKSFGNVFKEKKKDSLWANYKKLMKGLLICRSGLWLLLKDSLVLSTHQRYQTSKCENASKKSFNQSFSSTPAHFVAIQKGKLKPHLGKKFLSWFAW